MKLGVNIDHVATLREARKGAEPDVLSAAEAAIAGGADGITVHLREDRRHIQDRDALALRAQEHRLNLEMAIHPEIVKFALEIRPEFCCLVPENRHELTTEGGLDVQRNAEKITEVVKTLSLVGIRVSLFIDPVPEQIAAAKATTAEFIEIHTGLYANAMTESAKIAALSDIQTATVYARSLGIRVNAGHGLNYQNVKPVAKILEIEELNIGHSIISRALFVGLKQAVSEMKTAISLATESE